MSHTGSTGIRGTPFAHVASALIGIALFMVLLLLLPSLTSAESGAPPTNGATTEEWIIDLDDDIIRENEVLTINDHIKVKVGGKLTFSNTTLNFQKRGDGSDFHRLFALGGTISIINGSTINAPFDARLSYDTEELVHFTIKDSFINDVMILCGGEMKLLNNVMKNISYCQFQEGGSYDVIGNHVEFKDQFSEQGDEIFTGFSFDHIDDVTFADNYVYSKRAHGLWACTGGQFINNTFEYDNITDRGVYARESENILFSNNRFNYFECNNLVIREDSHHITIRNNTFHSEKDLNGIDQGISIRFNSNSITVQNNTFVNISVSVYIDESSHDCEVFENEIFFSSSNYGCGFLGIRLWKAYSINIHNNTIHKGGEAISLVMDCYSSRISNNTIDGSLRGIIISTRGHTNRIDNNEISGSWQALYISYSSHHNEVFENRITDTDLGLWISNGSHSSEVYDNSFSNSDFGISLTNGSHSIEIESNEFTNITWGLHYRNCIPFTDVDNTFTNVTYHVWHDSECFPSIIDQNHNPVGNVSVTIRNGSREIVYQGYTNAEGTLPWMALLNSTRTSQGTVLHNSYLIIVEMMGVKDYVQFLLAQDEATTIVVELVLLIDTSLDIQAIPGLNVRGNEIRINVSFGNIGTINLSSANLRIDITSTNFSLDIHDGSYENFSVGVVHTMDEVWFPAASLSLGEYSVQAILNCSSLYSEDTFIIETDVHFWIENSPPIINDDIVLDSNLTTRKNNLIVLHLSPHVLDFEDDIRNLTIALTDDPRIENFVISSEHGWISIEPFRHFAGTIRTDLTITDMDGDEEQVELFLTWLNRDPYFLGDLDYSWTFSSTMAQIDLSVLVADEDPDEEFSWTFESQDQGNGSLDLEETNGVLHIIRTDHHLASVDVYLTVIDASNGNSSQLFRFDWMGDLSLTSLSLSHPEVTILSGDAVDLHVTIHNSHELLSVAGLSLYVDILDESVWNGSFEIEERASREIVIPWEAEHGGHELIVMLDVTAHRDENLTNHQLRIPVRVFLPLQLTCEEGTQIPLIKGGGGVTITARVVVPELGSVNNVTVHVLEMKVNGVPIALPFSDGGPEGKGFELNNGLMIAIHPSSQTIDAGSTGTFEIVLTMNKTITYSTGDLVELGLSAEGDEGRSNPVVLQIMVMERAETISFPMPSLRHPVIILICGAILLPLGTAKVGSALSNSSFTMYRLSLLLFLTFPTLYAILCPVRSRDMEDDEALYNEYRNKICEILELKGEQGATQQEIMVHLKKWFPYGTTGNANPEDNRVTGVVREHLRVLRTKGYIRQLGDRYYFHSFQPTLPKDIYNPMINWTSLLREKDLKLKGETPCRIISTVFEKREQGIRNKELADAMDMSPCALHYHIKKLEKTRIIERRRGMGKRLFINTRKIQMFVLG